MTKARRTFYIDDSVFSGLKKLKIDEGIPLSRSLSDAAKDYLKKKCKL